MCVHVCACMYTLNCHPPLSLAQSLLAMLGWWAIDSWGSSCPCLPSAQMTGTTQVPWLAQKALSSLSHGQPHVHECRCLWCPAEGVRFPPATPPPPPRSWSYRFASCWTQGLGTALCCSVRVMHIGSGGACLNPNSWEAQVGGTLSFRSAWSMAFQLSQLRP